MFKHKRCLLLRKAADAVAPRRFHVRWEFATVNPNVYDEIKIRLS